MGNIKINYCEFEAYISRGKEGDDTNGNKDNTNKQECSDHLHPGVRLLLEKLFN